MTLMKCITLKYLKKINHYPYLIANVMILILVSSLLTTLSIFFNKKKLVLYWIMLRVIPLGLTLLYRYCSLTSENIINLIYYYCCFYLFSLLYSEITLCNVYYLIIQKMSFLIIVEFFSSEIKFFLLT